MAETDKSMIRTFLSVLFAWLTEKIIHAMHMDPPDIAALRRAIV